MLDKLGNPDIQREKIFASLLLTLTHQLLVWMFVWLTIKVFYLSNYFCLDKIMKELYLLQL